MLYEANKLRAQMTISKEKFEEIKAQILELNNNPLIQNQIEQEQRLQKLLDQSKDSMKSLTQEQLEEIQAYKNPPWRIKMAVEAIYFLLTSKVLTWDEIRKKMGDGTFVDKVL